MVPILMSDRVKEGTCCGARVRFWPRANLTNLIRLRDVILPDGAFGSWMTNSPGLGRFQEPDISVGASAKLLHRRGHGHALSSLRDDFEASQLRWYLCNADDSDAVPRSIGGMLTANAALKCQVASPFEEDRTIVKGTSP